MKLYLWKGERTYSDIANRDIGGNDNFPADHSSCLVIIAENKQNAMKMIEKQGIKDIRQEPLEIELDTLKECIITYADGDC